MISWGSFQSCILWATHFFLASHKVVAKEKGKKKERKKCFSNDNASTSKATWSWTLLESELRKDGVRTEKAEGAANIMIRDLENSNKVFMLWFKRRWNLGKITLSKLEDNWGYSEAWLLMSRILLYWHTSDWRLMKKAGQELGPVSRLFYCNWFLQQIINCGTHSCKTRQRLRTCQGEREREKCWCERELECVFRRNKRLLLTHGLSH